MVIFLIVSIVSSKLKTTMFMFVLMHLCIYFCFMRVSSHSNMSILLLYLVPETIVHLCSLFWRYYAWDYRVLRTFAKHYSTGDPIPENLVKSLQGAKSMFAATELQGQVCWPKAK